MAFSITPSMIPATASKRQAATEPFAAVDTAGYLTLNSFIFKNHPGALALKVLDWKPEKRELYFSLLNQKDESAFSLTSSKIKNADGTETPIPQYRVSWKSVLSIPMFGDVEGICYDFANSGGQKFLLKAKTTAKGAVVYIMTIPKGVHPQAPSPEALAAQKAERQRKQELRKAANVKATAAAAAPAPVALPVPPAAPAAVAPAPAADGGDELLDLL